MTPACLPPFDFTPGLFTIDELQRSPPTDHPPTQSVHPTIRKVQDIRMQFQAQGDTGANTSATNCREILWDFQTLQTPIDIQTYSDEPTSQMSTTIRAIGKGTIHIVGNDNSILVWNTLYVPSATGTVISPDRFMMDNQHISTLEHTGNKQGKGALTFYDQRNQPVLAIDMYRTHAGLWYTRNPILVPPQSEKRAQTPRINNMTAGTPAATQQLHLLELWHQRYGHPSHRVLLQTQAAVDGIPNLPKNLQAVFKCPFCDKAKIKKASRTKTNHRPTDTPSIIYHMDIGFIRGPSNLTDVVNHGAQAKHTEIASRDGYVCYLLIIDAATRYIWTFPLKSKRPPIQLIDSFLAQHGHQTRVKTPSTAPIATSINGLLAKSSDFAHCIHRHGYTQTLQANPDLLDTDNQDVEIPTVDHLSTTHVIPTEPNITPTTDTSTSPMLDSTTQTPLSESDITPNNQQGVIRTDNGGELAGSNAFRHAVARHQYLLEPTAPDASSQNGMAERPHRTLKDKVRCLLYTAGLGTIFWADALLHATWLYNRTYHSAIRMTPFQRLTGRKPACDAILTFGTHITAKKAKHRNTALDPNTFTGIFLGYCATRDNIRYWDTNAQCERRATHNACDEFQYGLSPEGRSPAAKHLLDTFTGTDTSHNTSARLVDQAKQTLADVTIAPATHSAQDPVHSDIMNQPDMTPARPTVNPIPPSPTSADDTLPHVIPPDDSTSPSGPVDIPDPMLALVTKARAIHRRFEDHCQLVDELQQLEVSTDPWNIGITETIPLRGNHPTLGMQLQPHEDLLHTTTIHSCLPGSPAGKAIRRFKSRLQHAIVRSVDMQLVFTPRDIEQIIADCRQRNQTFITVTFTQLKWHALTGEGLPLLHFDQLNVIAHHLRAISSGSTTWTDPLKWPPLSDDAIYAAIHKGVATPKLTRKRLLQSPHWPRFLASEWTQLDKYLNQGMFGTPCRASDVRGSTILPWVWTYLFKVDPVSFEQTPKSRGTCNGGPRYGKMVTLAETYAACVEQAIHRLMWAIVAALGYIALGCDVANAFAEAPPPKEQFYMHVDNQFRQWWEEHLERPPLPPDAVVPILRNLQGHPEAPRLWHRHIHAILHDKLGFSSTTHEPCLYYRRTTEDQLILILRQVDDFLIAAPTLALCQQTRQAIQDHVSNPLHDLGIVKRFNGIDIDQTANFVKVHCTTYIDKIVAHHDWSNEHAANIPVPMRTDSTYQHKLQLAEGSPHGTTEATALENLMGFSYRQAIGELIFAMTICRPDISPAVIQLSQYSANPAKEHYQAVKAVFVYLNATRTEGIYYWRPAPRSDLPAVADPTTTTLLARLRQFPDWTCALLLVGGTDSTWAADRKHRRSMGGVVILLAGGAVYYRTRLQPDTAQSSTEAELYSMTDGGKAGLYLRSILEELGLEQSLPTNLHADNYGATQIPNAQQPTRRTRHVDMKHFVIMEWSEEDKIKFVPVATEFNYSDSMSKPNAKIKHYEHNDIVMGRRPPLYVKSLHAYIHSNLSTFRILPLDFNHSSNSSSVGECEG